MVFLTADTHFGHINLTQAGKTPSKARPFQDAAEMEEELVRRWNSVVGPRDSVYHLGDVVWGRGRNLERYDVLNRLNGKIHLIRGNHDRDIWQYQHRTPRFESIQDLVTIKYCKRKVVLCHYPLESWDCSLHGSAHFHGHTHGSLPPDLNRLRQDVGVDCWDFTPVHIEALLTIMDDRAEAINRRAVEHSRATVERLVGGPPTDPVDGSPGILSETARLSRSQTRTIFHPH